MRKTVLTTLRLTGKAVVKAFGNGTRACWIFARQVQSYNILIRIGAKCAVHLTLPTNQNKHQKVMKIVETLVDAQDQSLPRHLGRNDLAKIAQK